MNRRTALKLLGIGTVACLTGTYVYADTKNLTWTHQPERVVWHMDKIKVVELRYENEVIEIDTKEIFDALKEDFKYCIKPK
jgi:hypothetical protein